MWNQDFPALVSVDNTIGSLNGLREEYYDQVQGLDVDALKVIGQDDAFDTM